YVAGVARLVARETALATAKRAKAIDEFARVQTAHDERLQEAIGQLENCLGKMSSGQRDFLLEYYQGDSRERIERRKSMADRLKLPLNAVRNRALRLREKLEGCVERDISAKTDTEH